jgi:hypothetical protein
MAESVISADQRAAMSVFSRSSVALSVSLAACFAKSRRTKDGWNPQYADAKRIDH